MKTIKLTEHEYEIVKGILSNLAEQIDEEVCNLIPEDADDDEADRVTEEARKALSKLY